MSQHPFVSPEKGYMRKVDLSALAVPPTVGWTEESGCVKAWVLSLVATCLRDYKSNAVVTAATVRVT